MRGEEATQPSFLFLGPLEERIPEKHPLRPIRRMTDQALRALSPLFEAMYADRGRPSIPPEYLLRALLLQVLYAIPSERKLSRAPGVSPALPLVRGPGYERACLAPHHLHPE